MTNARMTGRLCDLVMVLTLAWAACLCGPAARAADAPAGDLRTQAAAAMRGATAFYTARAAVRGGYVYYYSADFAQRWGEGKATASQAWVQPPGTPTVGLAFLRAYEATGDRLHLDAARATAEALLYGQLESGGWTYVVDFDPAGPRVARYRNGRGRGRNYSTLDDDVTQAALRFLIRLDRALDFADKPLHEGVRIALDALLAAQFPSGGFPQGWAGPVARHPAVKASFPDYDWRTENRVKDYWDLPTLNDDLTSHVARTLADAATTYRDDRYRAAVARLGDFLILAQLPDPQPAWAQQYDHGMRPAWARKFEPPAVTGRESQDAIETLLFVHRLTGDAKYLKPIPAALDYLRRSALPDGRLARFYELRTNKPLYMTRDYRLTHVDTDVPTHYAFKVASRVDALAKAYAAAARGPVTTAPTTPATRSVSADRVRTILAALDADGAWVSTYAGESLTGQPKFEPGARYIASDVFARNLETLSDYLLATRPARP